jgi:hypothetical protein
MAALMIPGRTPIPESRGQANDQKEMAGPTGIEPATSGVTGRRSNQLNYSPDILFQVILSSSNKPTTYEKVLPPSYFHRLKNPFSPRFDFPFFVPGRSNPGEAEA